MITLLSWHLEKYLSQNTEWVCTCPVLWYDNVIAPFTTIYYISYEPFILFEYLNSSVLHP